MNTRDQAVHLLNEAKLATNAEQKGTLMGQLSELVVRKDPRLIPEFMPEVTVLQVDSSWAMKRAAAAFVGEAVAVMPSPPLLDQSSACLRALLYDHTPHVVKQAVFSCVPLARSALIMFGAQPEHPEVRRSWESVYITVTTAADVALAHANSSVKVAGIKLTEQLALMFTSETAPIPPHAPGPPPPLPDMMRLRQSCIMLLTLLLNTISPPAAAANQSSVVLVTLVRTLGAIACCRPAVSEVVLKALVSLAKEGGFKSLGLEGEGGAAGQQGPYKSTSHTAANAQLGTDLSVGNALRYALAGALKVALEPLRDILVEGLTAIGAEEVARNALKYARRSKAEKGSSRQRSRQPGTDSATPEPATKRARADLEVSVPPQNSRELSMPQASTPTLADAPLTPSDVNASSTPAVPAPAFPSSFFLPEVVAAVAAAGQVPLSTPEDMNGVLVAIDQLTSAGYGATVVEQFLSNLPAELTVDTFCLSLYLLPESLTSEDEKSASTSGAPNAAAAPTAGTARADGIPRSTSDVRNAPATPPVNTGPPTPPRPQRPGTEGARAVPSRRSPRPTPPPILPPPSPQIRPVVRPASLGPSHLRSLRLDAVKRIMKAGTVPMPQFRQSILARLSAASIPTDGVSTLLLDHILASYKAGGAALALSWLLALFVDSVRVSQAKARGGGQAGVDDGDIYEDTGQLEYKDDKETKNNMEDDKSLVTSMEIKEGNHVQSKSATRKEKQGKENDGLANGSEVDAVGLVVDNTTQAVAENREVDVAQQLVGSEYERVLILLLQGLRKVLTFPADKGLEEVLLAAPMLPFPATLNFLSEMLTANPESATAALRAAREIIRERPPLREAVLMWVLDAACATSVDVREKAVRLVANQLWISGRANQAAIRAHAAHCLELLAGSCPDAAAADQASPERGWTLEAASRYASLYMALCARAPPLLPPLLTVYANAPPSVRAAIDVRAPSLAKALGGGNAALLALVRAPPEGAEKLLLDMVTVLAEAERPPQSLVVAVREWYHESLDIQVLAPVFYVLPKSDASALLPRLLDLPAEALRTQFRRLASPNHQPPHPAPAPPAAGASAPPALPPPTPLFAPAELLVALHHIEPRRDGVALKVLVAAVELALHAPEVFPQQAIAQAIQQLEVSTPLPPLFMRTVITALQAAPRLNTFVMELLSRLVGKQIWLDLNQWQGFLICADKHQPQTFGALLQLPASVLSDALRRLPNRATKVRLATYALSPKCTVHVMRDVRELLGAVLQEHQQLQAAVEVAAAVAKAALQEAEAPKHAATLAVNASQAQPLLEGQSSDSRMGKDRVLDPDSKPDGHSSSHAFAPNNQTQKKAIPVSQAEDEIEVEFDEE